MNVPFISLNNQNSMFTGINFGMNVDFMDSLNGLPVVVDSVSLIPILVRTQYSLRRNNRHIDVNTNILLVLFPLDIAPMGPLDGDPHRLRPDVDYPIWRHRLPEGYVAMDEARISFS